MSNISQPNPRQAPPRGPAAIVPIIIVTLGLLLGSIFGHALGWNRTIINPLAGSLSRAEQEFRAGHYGLARWQFKKLANNNNATARYWLADMTEHGLGAPPDPQKALDLYVKASRQGFVPAELRLGEIYLRGDMVLPDFAKAKTYLEEAAYKGSARAALLLGQMYHHGIGQPPNPKAAYAWLEVASLEGSTIAQRDRVTALDRLDAADQRSAIARAQTILAQIDRSIAPVSINADAPGNRTQ